MNLSDLNAIPIKRQTRKRVGRGQASGNGKTAGRGHKGQKSRSGYSRKVGFEGGQMPLYRRLPKKGFTNALFKVTYDIVNTGQLNDFDDDASIDIEVLKASGLIKKNAKHVKVLAKGALTKKLNISVARFSAVAVQMIESAGGQAQELAAK
ncbi:MAG: large subunit ribosomal protein L15 [Planctomycetota bacterium]|jgi:large subunit ribosomal protein L15